MTTVAIVSFGAGLVVGMFLMGALVGLIECEMSDASGVRIIAGKAHRHET